MRSDTEAAILHKIHATTTKRRGANGKPRRTPPPSKSRSTYPSAHSEKARAAVLRCHWSPRSPMLAVTYDPPAVTIELATAGQPLLSGPWNVTVKVDGRSLPPAGSWEQVCWQCDYDVDYLELSAPLAPSWRIERHMLLCRRDRFLLLGDCVLGSGRKRIEYQSTIPLAPDMALKEAAETRECTLHAERSAAARRRASATFRGAVARQAGNGRSNGNGRARSEALRGSLAGSPGAARALVLPVALGEWRSDGATGQLATQGDQLALSQSAVGGSLYAPLFIDLDPRRIEQPCTWRRLTVAARLKAEPPDVASGFRIQVGNRQWLIYRALACRDNRTVLGQNLLSEFFVGRFQRKGTTESLLEIE